MALPHSLLWLFTTAFRFFPWPTRTGLRAMGRPGPDSPVLLTGNFALTVARVERGRGYATIERDGKELRVHLAAVPGATKERPPFRVAFYDVDRVVGVEEPFDGARGEFLRDDAGEIRFFRWGGRLLPRHAEPHEELSSSWD